MSYITGNTPEYAFITEISEIVPGFGEYFEHFFSCRDYLFSAYWSEVRPNVKRKLRPTHEIVRCICAAGVVGMLMSSFEAFEMATE